MEEKIQKLLLLLDTPQCHKNATLRHKAINALVKIGTPAIAPTIDAFRVSKSYATRECLHLILVKMGKSILPDLQLAINDEQDTRNKYVLLSILVTVVAGPRHWLGGRYLDYL